MKYLLDTNVCIRVMKGDPRVTARMRALRPDDCGVSMVSVYELFFGVERCRNPEREADKLLEFLKPLHLWPFDWDAALRTAAVRRQLEASGNRIGPYDLQLAGQALALDVVMVTNNTREFRRVEGLKVEDWESE
ncbi:MAG: type II toxin-antitoxin system VapC family toxin [Verrucomicrobiota bacterium]